MADTLRQLIADVLFQCWDDMDTDELADALLASPELAAIIDLAAEHSGFLAEDPTQRALLDAWRASGAEQKPEQ